MHPGAFVSLPLGAVRPNGWLRRQLQLQAEGFTGRLPEVWPDVGPNSAWLGGEGEDWERGPYYCDGLIPLAYLLDDPQLIGMAKRWVEWSLHSQRPDGFFGPTSNDDWWPRMVMLKALTQYQEATDDSRVIPFLERYFAYQLAHLEDRPLFKWGKARGAENVLAILWLYNRTGDESLLRLMDLVIAQTLDWGRYFAEFPVKSKHTTGFDHLIHVVNVAMGLKEPALRFVRSGEPIHRLAVYDGLANLDRYHGQATGMFSGDEWLSGREPFQGVELCAVVEFMFTLEHLVRIFGDVTFADRLEQVAYNNLPATITADMRARQYDQQPNQVLCTVARRVWTANGDDSNIFGLEPNFGCCTANLHQGWPKLASSLWMASPEGGLVAVAYGPCTVTARVGDQDVVVIEDTEYPFDDVVRLRVHVPSAATFPLLLRIPNWCERAAVRINGAVLGGPSQRGFVTLHREWRDGDVVELDLSAPVRVVEREHAAIAVQRGPLTFALQVGENWRRIAERADLTAEFSDWEVYPTTPWNVALVVDRSDPARSFRLERGVPGDLPFSGSKPVIRLVASGQRVPEWSLIDNSAGPVPDSPVSPATTVEEVTLIPYGCARLRVTELPYANLSANH